MDDTLIKPEYSEPTLGTPDGSVNLEEIFGEFPRVTSAPTWVPRRFMDGFAIDTTNNLVYYYNFVTNAWHALGTPTAKGTLTITSSATPSINTDTYQYVTITALGTAVTSFTTNLSGTPINFQPLVIRIKDDGTARALTWGASFASEGAALPTTTTLSKVLTVGFMYDSVKVKWGAIGAVVEP